MRRDNCLLTPNDDGKNRLQRWNNYFLKKKSTTYFIEGLSKQGILDDAMLPATSFSFLTLYWKILQIAAVYNAMRKILAYVCGFLILNWICDG